MKFISIREFVDEGYLQEVNRQFFHPLGLALVVQQSPGVISILGVQDLRDDLEGFVFGGGASKAKASCILVEALKRAKVRQTALGFVIQPAEEE